MMHVSRGKGVARRRSVATEGRRGRVLRALLDSEEHTAKPGDAFASNARSCVASRSCSVADLFRGGHKFSGDPKSEFDAALEALDSDGDAEEALAHIARCAAASGPENKEAVENTAQRALDAAAASSTAVDALRRALAEDNADASKDWSSAAEALARLVRSGRPLKWAVWLARARLVLGDAGGAEQVAGAALQALEKHNPKADADALRDGRTEDASLDDRARRRGALDKATRFGLCGNQPVRRDKATRFAMQASWLGLRHASMAWRTAR